MSDSDFTRRLAARKPRPGLLLPLSLGVAVLCSAVMVVQVKNDNRRLTNESTQLRDAKEALDVEWSQLQLEEAAHSSHSRIETIARNQLKMVEPRETVMVSARDTVPERSEVGAGAGRVGASSTPSQSGGDSDAPTDGGAVSAVPKAEATVTP